MKSRTDIVVLNKDNLAVQILCAKDKRLSKVIDMVGEIIYKPHTEDGYSFLVHEIIEQMLSIKSGAKIYGRLEELCDGRISPTAIAKLSVDEIKSTGTSNSKANYILGMTKSILDGDLVLEELQGMSDGEVFKKLTKIRGIGSWTAKMYLLFVLDRQDILPIEDAAFLQSYKWMYRTDDVSREAVTKKCLKWKPYSSIAARYLYRALDMGLTKKQFHLFKNNE